MFIIKNTVCKTIALKTPPALSNARYVHQGNRGERSQTNVFILILLNGDLAHVSNGWAVRLAVHTARKSKTFAKA